MISTCLLDSLEERGVSTLWVVLTWKSGLLKQSHIQGLWCSLRVCRLERGSRERLERLLSLFQLYRRNYTSSDVFRRTKMHQKDE
jgi:hypothetical protein